MISQILLKISKSIKQYSENHLTKSYYKTYMIQCCVKAINTLLYYQPVIFLGGGGQGWEDWEFVVKTHKKNNLKDFSFNIL